MTPRIFIELTRVIPSTGIAICDGDFRLLLVKTISTDLGWFRFKLLVADHASMLFSSSILVSALHAGVMRHVSSAYLTIKFPVTLAGKSAALITYVTYWSKRRLLNNILADLSNKLNTSPLYLTLQCDYLSFGSLSSATNFIHQPSTCCIHSVLNGFLFGPVEN